MKADQEPESPESRWPTPAPLFDIQAFARESDRKARGTQVVHDASEASPRRGETLPSAPDPAPLPRAEERLALAHSLGEHAHRTALLRALLRVGGVSRVEGARALRAELGAIEDEAAKASDSPLAAMAGALRLAIEEIGGLSGERSRSSEILVWVGRDDVLLGNVAVAAESQGIAVRVASGVASFWAECLERRPSLVAVRVDACGFSAEEICTLVRQALGPDVSIVLLGLVDTADVGQAEDVGATRAFRGAVGVDELIAALAELLPDSRR